MQYLQNNQDIRPRQQICKRRVLLHHLVSFFHQETCLVDEGKAMEVVSLDFSQAFSTVSHSIFLENLALYSSFLVYKHLHGWAQRVMGNGVTST